MKVRLAYGQTGLDVELPDRTTVVRPTPHAGAPDERAALREALCAPVSGPRLRELARPGQRVAISMCDGTRAQPRELMIPAVLDELTGIVPDADVVILVATGTHRGNTDDERVGIASVVVDDLDAREDLLAEHRAQLVVGVAAVRPRGDEDHDVRVSDDARKLVQHRRNHQFARLRARAVAHRDRDSLARAHQIA